MQSKKNNEKSQKREYQVPSDNKMWQIIFCNRTLIIKRKNLRN